MSLRRSRSSTTFLGAAVSVGIACSMLGAAAPAAFAEDGAADEALVVQPSLEATALEDAADFTGIPEAELEQLEESGEVQIGPGGHVAFIDPAPEQAPPVSSATESFSPLAMPIPGSPAGGSRPGAPVTVFLDFDGAVVEKTSWNRGGDARYDLSGAAVADTAFQAEVWARIAEDYAPFNINVTTVDPGPDALFKTSASDTTYGSWLVITDSYPAFGAGSGGIASYQGAGSRYHAPAFVFTTGTGGGNPANATAKAVAEAGSHEIGHNFGLDHDGIGAEEYYTPAGGLWGPIMGAPYYSPLTQWSKGDYAGATRTEDDLALITDRAAAKYERAAWQRANGDYYYGPYCTGGSEPTADGDPGVIAVDGSCGTEVITAVFTYTDRADYAADDHGNDAAGATALNNAATNFTAAGVIGTTGDVDVFKFTTNGGPVTAQVEVANVGPNLDTKLTLTNASGTVLAENAPAAAFVDIDTASGLGAQVTATVPAGTYYLTVDGVGQGNPNNAAEVNLDAATAYNDYGSLGHYRLAGTAAPFVAIPVDIVTPAEGSTVTGGAPFAVTGTAHPGATVTLTVGGSVVATVTADATTGAWTANVTANATGATIVVAAETVGGIEVAATDSVTVNAEVPAVSPPVISGPANGSETGKNPTFSGTGVPGAQVTVTVTGPGGAVTTLTATVDANGAWTVTAGSDLPNGSYTATATQTVDGRTSESSRITFTVKAAAGSGSNGGGAGGNGTAGGTGTAGGSGTGAGALPVTGGFDLAPFGLAAAGLLLVAAGVAIAAVRGRRAQNAS